MGPLGIAMLAGGMDVAGGLAGKLMDINQARVNRQFQLDMSNTSYQRASADMKAAGLNPAMMYGGGSGASTPSGSAATGGSPFGSIGSDFASAFMAAQQSTADVALKVAQSAKVLQETKTEEQLTDKAMTDKFDAFQRFQANHGGSEGLKDENGKFATLYRMKLLRELEETGQRIRESSARSRAIEEEGPGRRFRNDPFMLGVDAVEKGTRAIGNLGNLAGKLKISLPQRGVSYGGKNSSKSLNDGFGFDNVARPITGDYP